MSLIASLTWMRVQALTVQAVLSVGLPGQARPTPPSAAESARSRAIPPLRPRNETTAPTAPAPASTAPLPAAAIAHAGLIPPLRLSHESDPTAPPGPEVGLLMQGQDALVRAGSQGEAAAKKWNTLAYRLCRDAVKEPHPPAEQAAALLCQGWAALRTGSPEEAIRLAMAAQRVRPTMAAHLLLGDGYRTLNNCAEARPEYFAAIEVACTPPAVQGLHLCGAKPPQPRCPP